MSDRTENIVRKGENAGYQHFFLFPYQTMFSKAYSCSTSRLFVKELLVNIMTDYIYFVKVCSISTASNLFLEVTK